MYANLQKAQLPAIVPRPLLASKRALVMGFIDGFKITDEESLAAHRVDRDALMRRIVQVGMRQHLSSLPLPRNAECNWNDRKLYFLDASYPA